MNNNIHPDLLIACRIAYEPNELTIDNFIEEAESKEYGACTFKMNNQMIKFRASKITPKKIGQFVTLWKRTQNGPIIPYDMADPVELFIISVRSGENLGQFIFPKDVLREKKIISQAGTGGKLAMRVYPPWDSPDNQQAKKAQTWQLLYFAAIEPVHDIQNIRKLIIR